MRYAYNNYREEAFLADKRMCKVRDMTWLDMFRVSKFKNFEEPRVCV